MHILRVLVLMIAGLVPFAGLAQTPASEAADRGYLTNLLEENLSSAGRQVIITGFKGALSSQATIAEMTFADDTGVWLTLRGIVLEWNRAALLRGRVEITTLTATEIILPRAPNTGGEAPVAEAKGFSLPDLPVSVQIGELKADRVELGAALFGAGAIVSLDGTMSLAGGEGTAELAIARIDGKDGALTLKGGYANSTRQLALALSVTEAADGIAVNLIGLPGAPALDLQITGNAPIDDFTADIMLATDGQDRLTGQVQLTAEAPAAQGTDDAPLRRFRADLGGDIAPLFAAEYRDFFGPDITLHAEGASYPSGVMEVSALELTAQAIRLAGSLRIGADGLPDRFDLTGDIASADGAPVVLPLPGVKTEIGSAVLAVQFDAAQEDGWTGTFNIKALNRPDFAAESITLAADGRIPRGSGEMVGTNITFAATGLAPPDVGLAKALGTDVAGTARLEWVPGQPLNLREFALNGTDYGLTASGKFGGIDTGFQFDGLAKAQIGDISRLSDLAARSLTGALKGEISGSVSALAGTFDLTASLTGDDLTVAQAELDRLLAGQSKITASVQRDENGIRLHGLSINARTLTAKAAGTLQTGASDITADLDFTDLSVLGGPYGGALSANAHLTEVGDVQSLVVQGQGDGLSIGQPQLDGLLRGTSTIALQASRQSDTITVQSFDLAAATLKASASGVLKSGASSIMADLDFSDLSVLGAGYRGALSGTAGLTEQGTARSLTLTATGQGLAIGQTEADRLLSGTTDLTLNAVQDQGVIKINAFKLSNPQLTATATGEQNGNGSQIALEARLANLALLIPDFPGALALRGTLRDTGGAYVVDVNGTGPGGIAATISGTAQRDFRSVDLAITGSAQAALANAFIEPRSVQGPLSFDLRMNGAPGLAALSGSLNGTGLRVATGLTGLALENANLQVQMTGGRAQVGLTTGIAGTAGAITVNGPVGLTAPYSADLDVRLAGVVLRDPDLYQTVVDGSVTVVGPLAGGAQISGALALGDTEIRVPSTGLGGSEPIPDLVHRHEPADVRATRARAGLLDGGAAGAGRSGGAAYGLNLAISAPNRVFIRGRGLDVELGGALQLSGTTANVIPIGEFNLIRGRLDILGKRFDLTEGQARLQGEFVPYIRLVASTDNDGITANIIIEGQATDPIISFTSSPELPQEEVLAQLLFGRDLTSISPLQAAQLASAVATLAGTGGEGIVAKLRKGFGLDDLDISTDAEGNTAVKAGKYLSENVYTDVTVGSDGKSKITLNLDVTPSITLRGAVGSDGNTGIGVFYEKDY